MGLAYINLNRDKKAIESLQRAIRINPELTGAWYCLGVAYVNLNRNDDAIDAYLTVLRINPEDAEAWNNLGVAYLKLWRFNDSRDAFLNAIRINPKHSTALHTLGAVYSFTDNKTALLEVIDKLQYLDPDMANGLLELLEAYEIKDDESRSV
jgi:cytochrome c-type biogenesis protein CcmH/NrfG